MCRLLPGHCLFNALNGWAYTVSYEVIGWMACHEVGLPTTGALLTAHAPEHGSAFAAVSELTTIDSLIPHAISHITNTAATTYSPAPTSPATLHSLGLFSGSEPDPSWLKRCRASPKVQRKTAGFVTAMMIIGGSVSGLTSGFWGGYSDVHGRRPVLALAAASEVLSNTGFLL